MVYFKDTDDQLQALAEDLCSFARRVARDKNASPAELEILPEIAKMLFRFSDGL